MQTDYETGVEVSLREFIKADPQYIHVDLEKAEISATIEEDVKTSYGAQAHRTRIYVPGLEISFAPQNRDEESPKRLYLTWGQAKTFLAFLRLLGKPAQAPKIHIRYWAQNDSELFKKKGLHQETLILSNESGWNPKLEVHIDNVYEAQIQRIARS